MIFSFFVTLSRKWVNTVVLRTSLSNTATSTWAIRPGWRPRATSSTVIVRSPIPDSSARSVMWASLGIHRTVTRRLIVKRAIVILTQISATRTMEPAPIVFITLKVIHCGRISFKYKSSVLVYWALSETSVPYPSPSEDGWIVHWKW